MEKESQDLVRNVRRIRKPSESNTDTPNPPELEEMTWEAACSKGLIKPGMLVRFENNKFEGISLSEAKSGVKQTLSGLVEDGIIVQSKKGKILLVNPIRFNGKGITLRGRFGNAFGDEALKDVKDQIIKQTIEGKGNVTLLSSQEHFYFAVNSPLYQSFCNSNLLTDLLSKVWISNGANPSERCRLYLTVNGIATVNFVSEEETCSLVLVTDLLSEAKCCVKQCKSRKTSEPIRYNLNHYNKYITI